MKKAVEREPIGEPDAVVEYKSSEMRFSLAKAVYVYPLGDGWAADVVFKFGRDSTILGTPSEALREKAIQHAKAMLREARSLEHEHGTPRTKEKILHPFDLCGHALEVRNKDGDIVPEMVEYLISYAQGMFYDDCEGDITLALKDSSMLFAIRALSVMGYFHVPADPEREREKATIH